MSGRHPQPAVDGQDMLHAKKRFPFVDGCPDGVLPLAALFTFLAVAMGAVVCATGSGDRCPTWPGCRPEQTAPQWQLSPLTEFTHPRGRDGRRHPGAGRRSGVQAPARARPLGADPARVALVCARGAGGFGRLVVLSGPATWLGAVDLFCALTAKTAMGVPAVRVGARGPDSSSPSKTELQPVQVKRLAAVILTGLVVSHVTGIFAAGPHSYARCIGWPIWQLTGSDPHPWLAGPATGASGPGSSPGRHYGGTGRPLEAAT